MKLTYIILLLLLFKSSSTTYCQTQRLDLRRLSMAETKEDYPEIKRIVQKNKPTFKLSHPALLMYEIIANYFMGKEQEAMKMSQTYIRMEFKESELYSGWEDGFAISYQCKIMCLMTHHHFRKGNYMEAYKCTRMIDSLAFVNMGFFDRCYPRIERNLRFISHFCKTMLGDNDSNDYLLGAFLVSHVGMFVKETTPCTSLENSDVSSIESLLNDIIICFYESELKFKPIKLDVMAETAKKYKERYKQTNFDNFLYSIEENLTRQRGKYENGWMFEFRGFIHRFNLVDDKKEKAMEAMKNSCFYKFYIQP